MAPGSSGLGSKSRGAEAVTLEGEKEEGVLEEKESGSVLCTFSSIKMKAFR